MDMAVVRDVRQAPAARVLLLMMAVMVLLGCGSEGGGGGGGGGGGADGGLVRAESGMVEHLNGLLLVLPGKEGAAVVGTWLWWSPYLLAVFLCTASIFVLRFLSKTDSLKEAVSYDGYGSKDLTVSASLQTRTEKDEGKKVASDQGKPESGEQAEEQKAKTRIAIFFGTQTGTAERFSNGLAKEMRQRFGGVSAVEVIDIDEYGADEEELESKISEEGICFFLTATYGDGEPTDNAARFYKWLTEKAASFSSSSGEDDDDSSRLFLRRMSYAVFGLGNKQYEHYNAVGIKIDKCLEKLGASRMIPIGLGDDDVVIEDDFATWTAGVWPVMEKMLNIGEERKGGSAGGGLVGVSVVAEYRVVIHEKEATVEGHGSSFLLGEEEVDKVLGDRSGGGGEEEGGQKSQVVSRVGSRKLTMGKTNSRTESEDAYRTTSAANYDVHHPFRAMVVERRELHSPLSERSCVHVEFDLTGSGIEYEAGDHLGVFAENQPHIVEVAAKRLGYALDTVISLHRDAEDGSQAGPELESLPPPAFSAPCRLQTVLARYTDLLNAPRKTALLAMAAYAESPEEEAQLRRLASPEGKDEYASWVVGHQRSLLQVMDAFPSVRPSLGVFFGAIAPTLQPRYYSISSSPHHDPGRVHVTCAVVEETTRSGRVHQGVASFWLSRTIPLSQEENEKERGDGGGGGGRPVVTCSSAPVFVRSSGFRLPVDKSLPIVMIGPGTGLAPFRGFLQEREYLLGEGVREGMENDDKLGRAVLFFGCRSHRKDFIYKEELEAFLKNGALSTLHLAFSRDQQEKEYVQHKMAHNASELWNLLAPKDRGGQGGHLYVCGDAKAMAKDVHRAFLTIVQEREVVSASEADLLVKRMQQEGRYQRDVW